MSRYRHEALLYAGEADFLAATVPFLRDAVAAGEPALVAVGPRRLEALRRHVGAGPEAVTFVDMEAIGRNPACIIAAWQDFVAAHRDDGRRLRGIGEPVFPERSPAEVDECHRHEALLNVAFGGDVPLWLLCPYDTTALDPDVIRRAGRTHPVIRRDGTAAASDDYDVRRLRREVFADLPPDPPAHAARFEIDHRRPAAVRRAGCEHARLLGLRDERVDDLALVISELVSNTIRHGGGRGDLHVWREARSIVCQVRDRGSMVDPLTGRLRPPTHQSGGRGLWIVNQLCDLLQLRSVPGRTVVTAHLRLAGAAAPAAAAS